MCFVHLRDFAHALASKMGWKSSRLPFQDTREPVAQCAQRFWQTTPQVSLQLRSPQRDVHFALRDVPEPCRDLA